MINAARRTFLSVLALSPLGVLFAKKPFGNNLPEGEFDPRHQEYSTVCELVGEASMCWEHPERAGQFDSSRASQIADRIISHYADGIGDFKTARKRVCRDLAEPDFRRTYIDNIASMLRERIPDMSREEADELGEDLMGLLFTDDNQ